DGTARSKAEQPDEIVVPVEGVGAYVPAPGSGLGCVQRRLKPFTRIVERVDLQSAIRRRMVARHGANRTTAAAAAFQSTAKRRQFSGRRCRRGRPWRGLRRPGRGGR